MEQLHFKVQTTEGDNTYIIKLPTVGQYSDIEATKQILGKGFYNGIVSTNTMASVNAADMIDVEAHLTVLCPEFIKDLKVKSFRDLGLADFKNIRDAYIEQFIPWWKEIIDILRDIQEE